MDIPASTRSVVYELTAGQTGPLSWPYPLVSKPDLLVQRERGSGNETLVLDTDYAVTLVSGGATATVTLLAEAAEDDKIALVGYRQPARSTSFSDGGPLRHSDINGELERLTINVQELRRDVDRAVARDVFDDSAEPLVIDNSFRGKYLYIDTDGALVPADGGDGTGGGGLTVPVEVTEGGTGATTQAGARTNLGLGALATLNTARFVDIARGVVPITVESRATSWPPGGSIAAGTCYRVGGSPAGAWSAYTASVDIAEADGSGGWTRRVPAAGWLMYVTNEDVIARYDGSAWGDVFDGANPTTSTLDVALFQDVKAQNTDGGSATSGAWTTATLNASIYNTIDGLTLSSNSLVFTAAPGIYLIFGTKVFYSTADSKIRLYNNTTSTVVGESPQVYAANYVSGSGPASIFGSASPQVVGVVVVTAASETVYLQYHVSSSGPANVALGRKRNVSGESEVYARVMVVKLSAPRGAPGEKGDAGDAATVAVGTVTTGAAGSSAAITNSGTSTAAVLDFAIPRGDKGDAGDDGAAATVSVGTVTTGAAGSSASVANSGSSSAAVFDFTIPRGDAGAPGTPGLDGDAATVAVGTVTTGAAGSSASVTNSGTSSAAVLNFTIPRGNQGDPGPSTLDKASAGDDAAVTYTTASSGRARAGTLGDDDYHVEVSPDGSTWYPAVVASKDDGSVRLPGGLWDATTDEQHPLLLPTSVKDIWRIDTTSASSPRTYTISSVSSNIITLTASVAAELISASMAGVSMVRIWNTSKGPNESAWVDLAAAADQIRVQNASDIATWTTGETIRLGDPSPTGTNVLNMIAIDISQHLQTAHGAVFPQRGIKMSIQPVGTSGIAAIGVSGNGAIGTAFDIYSHTDGSRQGAFVDVFTDVLSPISNSNLIFVREYVVTASSLAAARLIRLSAIWA